MSNGQISQEHSTFEKAYVACGFRIPQDSTCEAFRTAIVAPFIPTEVSNPYASPGLGSLTRDYFRQDVYPALTEGIKTKDEKILALGQTIGRYLAASLEAGGMRFYPPLYIGRDHLVADGKRAEVTFTNMQVVEYGMGVNGFMSHLSNLTQDHYKVTAITRNPGEAAVIDGMADFFGVRNSVTNDTRGIDSSLNDMLAEESSYRERVDIIVASQVNTKAPAFKKALRCSSRLLATGGLVVVRGIAQEREQHFGYKDLVRLIQRDKSLQTEVDYTYTVPPQPGYVSHEMKLVMARKK